MDDAEETATLNATSVILDAELPLTTKIPITLDLYREFQRVPEGEIPDLSRPFEENGAADDPSVADARDSLLEAVQAVLTRAFRSSFALSALFAVLAGVAGLALGRRAVA